MPMVIQPLIKESVDSEISCIALSNDGEFVAWTTYNGLLIIMALESGIKKELKLNSYGKQIGYISSGFFIVGQEEGDLVCFSTNCEKVWEISCPGGCELMECTKKGELVAVIDGTNKLRLINSQGELVGMYSEKELIGMAVNENGSSISCWDDEGNLIVLSRNGSILFKRPINSKIGERIITAKYTQNGILLVSRETLDIPEEGEQNELEFWNPLGQKIGRAGFNSRCVSLTTNKNSIWAGLFSGEVLIVEENKTRSIWKSEYSITSMIALDEDLLVASWFYLYRINKETNQSLWKLEHEGIIDILEINEDKNIVALGGNDRNDYTNAAPMILINPNSNPVWEEESDEEYIEQKTNEIEDSNIYDNSNDDLKDLLGDEFDQYEAKNKMGQIDSMDDLMAAFNEESSNNPQNVDTKEEISLIEHLLSADEKRNQPPVCNAGDDQMLEVGEDGSCLVLLDGSTSHDPDGYIRIWNWTSEDGRSLSSGPKIKLRLPIGTHRFTLTVTDDDGAMSSDSISIIIR